MRQMNAREKMTVTLLRDRAPQDDSTGLALRPLYRRVLNSEGSPDARLAAQQELH